MPLTVLAWRQAVLSSNRFAITPQHPANSLQVGLAVLLAPFRRIGSCWLCEKARSRLRVVRRDALDFYCFRRRNDEATLCSGFIAHAIEPGLQARVDCLGESAGRGQQRFSFAAARLSPVWQLDGGCLDGRRQAMELVSGVHMVHLTSLARKQVEILGLWKMGMTGYWVDRPIPACDPSSIQGRVFMSQKQVLSNPVLWALCLVLGCAGGYARGQTSAPPRFSPPGPYSVTIDVSPPGLQSFVFTGSAVDADSTDVVTITLGGPRPWSYFSSVQGNPATFRFEGRSLGYNDLGLYVFGLTAFDGGRPVPAFSGTTLTVRIVPEPIGSAAIALSGLLLGLIRARRQTSAS